MDLTGSATIHATVGIIKVGMVKNVKGFCPKLPSEPFCNIESFEKGHIRVKPARPRYRITTCVAEGADIRTCPRTAGVSIVGQRSCRNLIPLVDGGIGN